MRLTNIQLIHAAHHAARYLPKASAELVRELATRLDVALVAQRETAKQRDALAAENAGLKKYICDECYVENVSTGRYACAGHGMPSTPATDTFLAEVRAQAHKEGAHFVANRMLAAWEAGFIEDTAKNAADIARMILTSTEFMANAPEGDFDRSFADGVLEDIAAQLRKGASA